MMRRSGTATRTRSRRSPRLAAAIAAVALSALASGRAEAGGDGAAVKDAPTGKPPVLLQKLGDRRHPITTSQPDAQRYFDQGLTLTFGFNHEAAVRSFSHAAELDPKCAMCFWGVALALGPNINAPMGPVSAVRAYRAVQRARALAPGASPRERAYIEALATRYAAEPPEDRGDLDAAYAEAMRALHRADPDDVDAATLYAEALMDRMPWNYWTDDGKPREGTQEVLEVLEGVLAAAPDHVGANHYYIHAVEEFYPERAEAAADRLGDLAPGAGHLVHMPSHIYWRIGRYDDALEINQRAARADEDFFTWCRAGAFYRMAYYPHNVHFLWAAAAAEGRSQIALTAARKLAAETRESAGEFPFVQEFIAIPSLTLVRFGQWDAVLGQPRPDPNQRYVTGIWHYARGLARLRTGDLEAAEAETAALREVRAEESLDALMLGGGSATAATLLDIAIAHLDGELAAVRGQSDRAVTALETAVALQDALTYTEPPPWYFPVRQALGAVLLEAGRAAEAEAVYRVDLQQYPRNGWSLFGLARSLRAQDKPEAALVEQGFENAWARADVKLEASRF